MVRHLVSWKFKPEISAQDRVEIAEEIQKRMDAVRTAAHGVESVRIIMPPLSTSSVDLILDGVFESEEDLAAYQVHPGHVEAVAVCIKPNLTDRTCCDYVI